MMHVLVVEDSPTQAARLCGDLEGGGFRVTLANRGAEALRELERTTFDVIVSDVVMPGMTGYELCRTVKDDPRHRAIPVILLTSLTDPLEVVNGLESGADNFMRKPYDVDQLLSRVRGALTNRELRSSGRFQLGVQLSFLDREFEITADKQQILDLLISTFEELVVTSREVRRHEADLEQQLHLVELERKRLRAVVDAVPVPLFVTSADGVVTHASEASARVLLTDLSATPGSRLDEVVTFVDTNDEHIGAQALPHHRALKEGVPSTLGESFDLFVARPDGVRVPVVLEGSPFLDEAQRTAGCVATVHALGGLAEHDPLTGLPNAATFLDRVAGLLGAQSRRSAVLAIELDRFDLMYASLAKAERTAIIVEVARALRQVFGSGSGRISGSESLLAHLGSKRFGVLLTNLPDSFRPMHLAETARRAISSVPTPDAGPALTASVGVAVDDASEQNTHLFAAATEALGRALSLGGNRVETLGTSAAQEAMDRLQLEIDLRAAIARDQIALHYQPEYDVRSGQLVGFEALARWHHPVHGYVAPPVFISLAEQSGLIAALGRQLLRKACTDATSWSSVGEHGGLTVAVNVSTIQLRPELVDEVVTVLEETGLSPSRLMLEVTETAAMTNPEMKVPVIEELRRLGVRFALDDFGTGYSSLTQLTQVRFDQLKLDRSFVDSIDQSGTNAVVARSIITLAGALDIPVVAEGVETRKQLEVLDSLGCDLCQGYLLAKPMAGEEVPAFLAAAPVMDGDDRPDRPPANRRRGTD